MALLDNFRLTDEKEDFQVVSNNISNGIDFKGTNLWILIFAIFIASLGLNVNSTAVVIGAMLVSPLMGPIIGLGFGMAINDLNLLKRSFFSYLLAAGVGLTTSTIYFLISPINEAHSEILARTSPNIYDVLIAFFGGLAGILAISSKLKGNVIPGVAIATALMPPLCTAGYGLATSQINYFFGAFYLFLINTVFIALATLLTSRYLKFPIKHLPKIDDELKAKRIVWVVVIITLLPSIYFGYDIVRQDKYLQRANRFIDTEAIFPNDYLLKRTVDAKTKKITLTYGGQIIEDTEIATLKSKLPAYNLDTNSLEIRQGFTYLKDNKVKEDEKTVQLSLALTEKEKQLQTLQSEIDSINNQRTISQQIFKELKVQYPVIDTFILQNTIQYADSLSNNILLAVIHANEKIKTTDQQKIEDWMKVRLKVSQLKTYYDY